MFLSISRSLIISWPITSLLSILTAFTGLVAYANLSTCDPLASKKLTSPDQLLPYFMMRTLGSLPGLPGLFIAGIFSGALSSVSSFVNSLAAVTLEDFIRPLVTSRRISLSEKKAALISKVLALTYGVLCVTLTYVAEQMTGILQASLTIFGVVGGPLLALFTVGICTKWATPTGALSGFLASLVIGFWIGFGALTHGMAPEKLPTRTDGCPGYNGTLTG